MTAPSSATLLSMAELFLLMVQMSRSTPAFSRATALLLVALERAVLFVLMEAP
jgi:hypothetical protein